MTGDSILIQMPSAIVSEIHPVQYADGQAFSCDTCNDGALIIDSIVGGVPPYSILWSDGTTGNSMTGIHADSVIGITITDGSGCVFSDTGTLPRGDMSQGNGGLVVEMSQYPGGYNVSCLGCMDGWVHVMPYGGMPPYTFVWADADTSRYRTGLGVGTYNVTVTESGGQSRTREVTLIGPSNPLSVSLMAQSGGCTGTGGTLHAYANGGTPPYSYRWALGDSLYDSTYQSSYLTATGPGNYRVMVVDANADTVTAQHPVTVGTPITTTLSAPEVQNGYHALCGGDSVQITLNVSGGNGAYYFTWEHGSFQQHPIVTKGLWYHVRVMDMYGCQKTDSIEIRMPEKLHPKIHPHTYPNGEGFSCPTCNDGMFILDSISGGVSPYTHVWSNGTSGDTLSGIMADSLNSITITDALGCVFTASNAMPRGTIMQQPKLSLSYDRSNYPGGYNVSCITCMDGWISIQAHGGMAPYSYRWTDGDTNAYRSGLMAGNYAFTIRDSKGDSVYQMVQLLGPGNGLTVHIMNSTNGCDGNVSGGLNGMVNGGVPPYMYAWHRNGMQMAEMWSYVNVWQTGTYRLTVTDANGQTTRDSVNVGGGIPMTAQATAVAQYGEAHVAAR
jgi:hypothetical protein